MNCRKIESSIIVLLLNVRSEPVKLRRILLILLFFSAGLLSAPIQVSAQSTVVLDFESLAHGGTFISVPSPYSEDGFTITSSVTASSDAFTVFGPASSQFTGSAALASGTVPATWTLTNDNNDTFDLVSIDISEFICSPESCFFGGGLLTYTGTKADLSTVTHSFFLDQVFGLETIMFPSSFSGLASVSVFVDASGPQFHQIDNIVFIASVDTTPPVLAVAIDAPGITTEVTGDLTVAGNNWEETGFKVNSAADFELSLPAGPFSVAVTDDLNPAPSLSYQVDESPIIFPFVFEPGKTYLLEVTANDGSNTVSVTRNVMVNNVPAGVLTQHQTVLDGDDPNAPVVIEITGTSLTGGFIDITPLSASEVPPVPSGFAATVPAGFGATEFTFFDITITPSTALAPGAQVFVRIETDDWAGTNCADLEGLPLPLSNVEESSQRLVHLEENEWRDITDLNNSWGHEILLDASNPGPNPPGSFLFPGFPFVCNSPDGTDRCELASFGDECNQLGGISPALSGNDPLSPFAILIRDIAMITIDIKPGSDPNSVNPDAGGFLAVGILTTSIALGDAADFYALDVDPSTLTFGPAGAAIARTAKVKDVDGDGDNDLILHFGISETGITCGDTEATLTGETFSGDAFEGTDSLTARCN
jgi:hypothetical protein